MGHATILVPLDGSTLAEAALPRVVELARGGETTVLLVHAVAAHGRDGRVATHADLDVTREAEAYLSGVRERLADRGVRAVRAAVRHGPPARVIVEVAAAAKADLIVMSTHGRSGLDRMLLGSVAERVLRSTTTPTLLVREATAHVGMRRPAAARGAPRGPRVVVPLDGSPEAEAILPFLPQIAGSSAVRVHLLRVLEPVPPLAAEGAPVFIEDVASRWRDAEEYLAPVADRLARQGVDVRTEVRRGEVVTEILAAARDAGADLIAMTTHGRSGLGRLLFGSVAAAVLRTAAVPVFLMRQVAATSRPPVAGAIR